MTHLTHNQRHILGAVQAFLSNVNDIPLQSSEKEFEAKVDEEADAFVNMLLDERSIKKNFPKAVTHHQLKSMMTGLVYLTMEYPTKQ